MSSLRNSYFRISDSVDRFILNELTDDGSLSGDPSANINGSITSKDFYFQSEPNYRAHITEISILVSDNSSPLLNGFGSILTELTNGIQLFVEHNSVKENIGNPIKSNRQLVNLGPSEYTRVSYSASIYTNIYTFNIVEFAGNYAGLDLDGDSNDKIGYTIQDDLSSLAELNFTIGGHRAIKQV